MKKYTKFLIGAIFCAGICANGISSNKVNATSTMLRDPDLYPPTGIIEVEGAELTDGVYYISHEEVVLKITASDNRTKSGDLLMIVSGDKLTEDEMMNDKNWEAFKEKKEYKLTTTNNGLNRIHLYLKDEAGNISNSLLISSPETHIVTYSGDGTNLPPAKETKLGIIFPVSTQAPKLDGKYFLGWTATKGGSVQWGRDGIIEPQYIKGSITLFAVYSDTPPKLADMVSIGDYVDYPAGYTNVEGYEGVSTRLESIRY